MTTATTDGATPACAHGLEPGPEAVCEQDIAARHGRGRRRARCHRQGGAVVCASDALALGVLHAALARGWRAGRDVGIVGFDGSAIAEMSGLTSIAQPLDAIANHLLALVHDLLAGGTLPPPASCSCHRSTSGRRHDPSKKG